MDCPKCGSEAHIHQRHANSISYRCKNPECKKTFTVKNTVKNAAKINGVGMSLDQFRSKYDVDYILAETLNKLDPDTIYEKSDIYQMTGLSPSYPGLGHALDAAEKYYGKAGGRPLFSHPKTIAMLKETAKLK